MDARRFVAGTVVGGIVLFAVGYLIFTMAFADFYAANAGGATGVERETEIMWAVVLGSLGYAALISYAMGGRSGMSLADGAKVGAVVGFLMWFSVDFILYGVTDLSNLTRTIVDPILELVRGGIGGAAIALVMGKMQSGA